MHQMPQQSLQHTLLASIYKSPCSLMTQHKECLGVMCSTALSQAAIMSLTVRNPRNCIRNTTLDYAHCSVLQNSVLCVPAELLIAPD